MLVFSHWWLICIYSLFVFALPQTTDSKFPDLYEASLVELQDGLESGLFTSVDLIKVWSVRDDREQANDNQAYFGRIEEVNLQGPELRAIIETNPSALAEAAALDAERKISGPRGPLHGIPVRANV